MGAGTRTRYQHDAQRQPDGTVTLFDNGGVFTNEQSRGVVLELDMEEMRATLVREYAHPDKILAATQGNMQTLPNGNRFVGWGSEPVFSEFSGDGELLFSARLRPRSSPTAPSASPGPDAPPTLPPSRPSPAPKTARRRSTRAGTAPRRSPLGKSSPARPPRSWSPSAPSPGTASRPPSPSARTSRTSACGRRTNRAVRSASPRRSNRGARRRRSAEDVNCQDALDLVDVPLLFAPILELRGRGRRRSRGSTSGRSRGCRRCRRCRVCRTGRGRR